MLANGWKTAKEIMEDYELTGSEFFTLKTECMGSDSYYDAIIEVGNKTYVVEDIWQEFLQDRTNKKHGRKATHRKDQDDIKGKSTESMDDLDKFLRLTNVN